MGRTDVLKPRGHKYGHQLLDRAELPIDTASLARYLIGKVLVREFPEGVATGRIVETEAYIVGDAAGHAYVYLAYGTSYMLNVSSELPGIGAGVLIRALEPLGGIPLMRLKETPKNSGVGAGIE